MLRPQPVQFLGTLLLLFGVRKNAKLFFRREDAALPLADRLLGCGDLVFEQLQLDRIQSS